MRNLLLISLLLASCHNHDSNAVGVKPNGDYEADWALSYAEALELQAQWTWSTRPSGGVVWKARQIMKMRGWPLHCSTCGEVQYRGRILTEAKNAE